MQLPDTIYSLKNVNFCGPGFNAINHIISEFHYNSLSYPTKSNEFKVVILEAIIVIDINDINDHCHFYPHFFNKFNFHCIDIDIL